MVITVVAYTVLGSASQGQASPSLEFSGKNFIIRENSTTTRVPMDTPRAESASRALFRKDANYAVWDSRGLTIRRGKKTWTSRLPDIALTPKLFTRDEIRETKDLIAKGQRSKTAGALSGSRRVGDNVYFLVRWLEKDNSPWLEALVKVELSGTNMHAELLGRFSGLTLAKEKVDDVMYVSGNRLQTFTRGQSKSWGLAWYDFRAKEFDFRKAGDDLLDYWFSGAKMVLAEEQTEYGSKHLVRFDPETFSKRTLTEYRGTVTMLNGEDPAIMRFSEKRDEFLRNMDTGSELRLPKASSAQYVEGRVLIWDKKKPEKAGLFEPVRWNRVASVKTESVGSKGAGGRVNEGTRGRIDEGTGGSRGSKGG